MDYKSRKTYLNINKAFRVFSIAIIVSMLIPMIFSTGYMLYGFINNKIIDLSDHSIRLLFVIFGMVSYAIYFLIIEIYIIYSIIETKKTLEEKITVKHIILFIMLFLIFSIIQVLIILCAINENWLLLFMITLVLLLPYFYLIVKKIKIEGGRENYEKI